MVFNALIVPVVGIKRNRNHLNVSVAQKERFNILKEIIRVLIVQLDIPLRVVCQVLIYGQQKIKRNKDVVNVQRVITLMERGTRHVQLVKLVRMLRERYKKPATIALLAYIKKEKGKNLANPAKPVNSVKNGPVLVLNVNRAKYLKFPVNHPVLNVPLVKMHPLPKPTRHVLNAKEANLVPKKAQNVKYVIKVCIPVQVLKNVENVHLDNIQIRENKPFVSEQKTIDIDIIHIYNHDVYNMTFIIMTYNI